MRESGVKSISFGVYLHRIIPVIHPHSDFLLTFKLGI